MLDADKYVLQSICDAMPIGVIVMGEKELVYCNRQAVRFVDRYKLPPEVDTIRKNIFDAIRTDSYAKMFPGEIRFSKRYSGSPSTWIFSMEVHRNPHTFVSLFIVEEALSNKIDVNKVRRQYRLTRREADIVRRVLDGLKNSEIAEECDVTEQTVKDHLSNIYHKMGIRNRVHLMQVIMNSSEHEKSAVIRPS